MRGSPRLTGQYRVVYGFLDLNDGGAQRLTLAACAHLDPTRFVSRVLCVRSAGPLVNAAIAQGLTVDVLGRLRAPFDTGAVPALVRYLRACRADVVHVPLYSRAGPYLRLAARLAGCRLVVAHEWCRPARPRRLRSWSDRGLRAGTRFVAASEALRQDLIREGVDRDAVRVVYSGIDAARFAPSPQGGARGALGLDPDRRTVLVPARLHPMKGHIDLLAGMPVLRAVHPDVLVLAAGDGPLRTVLPALARSAGLADAVRFLGARDDIPCLLAACDVLALPSRIEGLPSVVLEAMCAERPVVATSVGGVGEVLRDGVGGWTVDPGDPSAFGAAVAHALSEPAEARRRALAGREKVLGGFTAAHAARRLEEAYTAWLAEDDEASEPHPVAEQG